MRHTTFGNTGLRVSEAFLGAMGFGEGWGVPTEDCRKIFTAYAEAGGNVVDTANRYTDGASERIVGELLGADRERFVLTTKYTLSMDGDDPNASGNHRKNLRRSVGDSLRRLGTDYIDLLWVHIWDAHTPIEETMRALDDLIRSGKVLYIGLSDAPAWVAARANTMAELRGWTPFAGLQLSYSLLERDIERELLPMADALDLSVAAWAPLARGVLTGKFTRDGATAGSRTRLDKLSERDLRIAAAADAVADDLGVPTSQVAIAWTRARHRWIHPIVAPRSVAQLTDSVAALDLDLPADALRRLDEASAFDLGFPQDFIALTHEFVYGTALTRFEPRRRR